MSADPPTYDAIQISVADAVATIHLARPARRNALTAAMLVELKTALDQAAQDDAVRAVVLTGAGVGFCAGQDLADLPSDAAQVIEALLLDHYKPVILTLATLPKPAIAAVNGIAAGAGAALALACDLRLMADDAALYYAFANVGLVPDAGATWLLARQVGYSRALEIALSGQRLPAQRCLELGLTNRVAPRDQLLDQAQAWAKHLAQGPTTAIALTKSLMQQALTSDLSTAIDREAAAQAKAAATRDHREGVTAFLEKRPPRFEGR